MFIRETNTVNRKNGKVYKKHTLVESYRSENGPRQRTIMQLGELDLPKKQWANLVKELESRLSGTVNEQLSFGESNKSKTELDIDRKLLATADKAIKGYFTSPKKRERQVNGSDGKLFIPVDLKSVTLIVDSEGFSVISRVYEGNVGEPSTLKEIYPVGE